MAVTAPGFIDTRLTQAKGNAVMEVGGDKVVFGIPDAMRDMALNFIPLGRHGTVDEAAGSVLLLCSPMASYISGHVLEVTGGAFI
jgi:3-oxoacyl-[acyl-carrier protein] reductase